MFDNWGRGSNIKTNNLTTTASSPNMFAALEAMPNDTDKRFLGSGRSSTRDPYSSKGPSLERNYKQQSHDNRRASSRSASQHRSGDNSQRSTPVPNIKLPPAPLPVATPVIETNPEKLEKQFKTILEEFTNDCLTIAEFNEEIKKFCAPADLNQIVVIG